MSKYPIEDERRYVRVICPKCRAVLHPRVEKAGRRVKCPDCYAAVLVPQPEAPPPPPKPARDPGQYKLGGADQPTAKVDYFLLLCPTCHARLHPRLAHVGKKVRCPDCEAVIVVPPPPKSEPPKAPKPPGQYRVGTEAERAEVKPELLLVQSTRPTELRTDETPPLWFASGVFTFPWRKSAAACWLTLSMFLLPLVVLLAAGVYLVDGLHVGSTVVAMLIVPLVWTFVWSMSYAAACSLGIMEGTAAGEDDVESRWPEESWRERIGPFAYVGFEFVVGVGAASLLALPIGRGLGPFWGGAAAFLLASFTFPLVLLSALEADSPMTPISPVILGSVPKLWWGWGLVAAESMAVMTLAAGLSFLAALATPVLALFVAPPLLAAAIFIIARLYGRLAWRIGELEAEKKRRKKKKKKRQAAEDGDS